MGQFAWPRCIVKRVILGITGSVAAIRTFEVASRLEQAGFEVRLVATRHARYFLDPSALRALGDRGGVLHIDEDEWPGAGYTRNDPVLHIELRRWADALVLAPLDANTLARIALGLSDNLLTSLVRAWDFARPMVLAPAMNTMMWESPITRRHLRQILADHAVSPEPADWLLDQAAEVFAACAPSVVIVPPQTKRLACGDVGAGAMADPSDIVAALERLRATA